MLKFKTRFLLILLVVVVLSLLSVQLHRMCALKYGTMVVDGWISDQKDIHTVLSVALLSDVRDCPISIESHEILAQQAEGDQVTAYVLSAQRSYIKNDGSVALKSGSGVSPYIVTLTKQSGNTYMVDQVATPLSGELQEQSVKELFPSNIAQKVIERCAMTTDDPVKKRLDQCQNEYFEEHNLDFSR